MELLPLHSISENTTYLRVVNITEGCILYLFILIYIIALHNNFVNIKDSSFLEEKIHAHICRSAAEMKISLQVTLVTHIISLGWTQMFSHL